MMTLCHQCSSLFQILFLVSVVSNKHCRFNFPEHRKPQNACLKMTPRKPVERHG
jgi:hypothetical protein